MADEIRLIAKGGQSGPSTSFDGMGPPFQRNLQEGVRFRVRPKITESRNATYVDAAIPGPAGVVVYATTSNTKFAINATFVSRTKEEADRTFREINLLNSWLVPGDTRKRLNPEIIKMYGYKLQFDGIPTVLQSISISYPDDVDYIEGTHAWIPIIQTVSFSLLETHTNKEIEKFDIALFKQGLMAGF